MYEKLIKLGLERIYTDGKVSRYLFPINLTGIIMEILEITEINTIGGTATTLQIVVDGQSKTAELLGKPKSSGEDLFWHATAVIPLS